jgi:uncharacterized membrane protein YgcG
MVYGSKDFVCLSKMGYGHSECICATTLRNPSLAEAADGDVSAAAASLPLAVRAAVLRLTGLSSAATSASPDCLPIIRGFNGVVPAAAANADADTADEGTSVAVPSAAAVRDSSLFPRHVREAAAALAALRSMPSGRRGAERVEAAAAALRNGGEGGGGGGGGGVDGAGVRGLGDDPEAVALFAPAAVTALRSALDATAVSSGGDVDVNGDADAAITADFADSAARLARAAAAVVARVAKNAPHVVAVRLLMPLLADLLAVTGTAAGGGDFATTTSTSTSSSSGDSAAAVRVAAAGFGNARDAVRCAMMSPSVLTSARLALGAVVYRRHVFPSLLLCLQRSAPPTTAGAAANALAASAADAGALPVVLRGTVRPLLRSLAQGPHVVNALARVVAALGTPATVKHVLPALEAVLGAREQHLPNVMAGAMLASGAARSDSGGKGGGGGGGGSRGGGSTDDGNHNGGGGGGGGGISASTIAAAEATAVKDGWAMSSLSMLPLSAPPPPIPGAQCTIAALAALEAILRSLPPGSFVERLFPRPPRAPGPLLSILLLPMPSLPMLLAAAAAVLTAAARAGAAVTAASLVPRLRPIFAVAATAPPPAGGSGGIEDPPAALAAVRELYPGLGDVLGLQTLRELVPEWSALEARLGACYGWSPSKEALELQTLVGDGDGGSGGRNGGGQRGSGGGGSGGGGGGSSGWTKATAASSRFGSRMSAVGGRLKEASAAANMALLEQMSLGWHGLGLPIDTAGLRYAAGMAGMNNLAANIPTKFGGGGGKSPSSSSRGGGTSSAAKDTETSFTQTSFTDGGAMGNGGYAAGEPWGWLPYMGELGGGGGGGADESPGGDRGLAGFSAEDDESWVLSLEVLASWRAHPRALRLMSASEDEGWFLTVGRVALTPG